MIKTSLLAISSVIFATAGQLFLKSGMDKVGYIGDERIRKPVNLVLTVARTPAVILGLTLFVCSAAVWLIVLSRAPLSFAYPFAGLTYLITALFAKFVLGERIPSLRWLGIALLIAGIVIVGTTAPPDRAAANDVAPTRSAPD